MPIWIRISTAEIVDYQDLKLKIVQQEGYDAHDFNIFDDRTAEIWRKPYLDGSARELTSGDERSTEQLRQAVEKMMIDGRNKRPQVRAVKHSARCDSADVKVTVDIDHTDEILEDARRITHHANSVFSPLDLVALGAVCCRFCSALPDSDMRSAPKAAVGVA